MCTPQSTGARVDLRQLTEHRESVHASDTLEAVYKRFAGHEYEFMLVMEGGRFVGLCERKKIGMLLGAQFGFALHARQPVRETMIADVTTIQVNQPLADVLAVTCSRPDASLYNDVVLLDEAGTALGVIFARTLVRLQNELLQENIQELERNQRELNAQNEQMDGDLQLAREIQLAMLPTQLPEIAGNGTARTLAVRFRQRYESAGVVSGDFFQGLKISDSSLGIFICDVMGHGVRAAFVIAMLRALLEEMRGLADNPGKLLTRINSELLCILKPRNNLLYATAFYLVVDAGQERIRYARAGHPNPLLLCRRTGEVKPLQSAAGAHGPVLGLVDDAHYGTSEGALAPEDLILLFTDGIYEVLNAAGREFGSDQLAVALQKGRALSLDALLDGLLAEARNHSATKRFTDDVCLVALEAVRI